MFKRGCVALLMLCFLKGFATAAQEWEVWPKASNSDHPKVANALEDLIYGYRAQRPLLMTNTLQQVASQLYAVPRQEDHVRVIVEAEAERVLNTIATAIEQAGDQVELSYATQIQALVPMGAIAQLADLQEVQFIRLPVRPILSQGTTLMKDKGSWAHLSGIRPA
ncbi:MAG: hypothetical protein NZ930_03460 [Candidatus Bipolaricaulota bacterium]|nr:hypothetical protein [Candidatus Bipolaricaulota bacterium]MDW8031489.1 hypothetical protein [Candidatus Bipolaricaulota bacterium]